MKLGAVDLEPLAAAARGVEAVSSAEVVVIVRRRSGVYRDVDLFVGAAVAMAALLWVLFHEAEYLPWMVPLIVAVAFVVGWQLSAWREFAGRIAPAKRRREQTRAAALAAFTRHGIGRTQGRTGLLIYWSLLERQVEAVLDSGVAAAVPKTFRENWLLELREVGHAAQPVAALAGALRRLGELLRDTLPVGPDDVNELADVVMAPDAVEDEPT